MAAPSTRSTIPAGLAALSVAAGLLVCLCLYSVFFVAPVEREMGIVQKIFYFHVPSAYSMYIGFAACGLGSFVYILKRAPKWDALAVAGAEVGLVFCAIVLITGPLWARKAWGHWWAWDPRLTTTMLAGMVFAAYVVLRAFGGGEGERKLAAALGIVGVLDLPVIHYSVARWRGQHPTVITRSGGGLSPEMYPALWLGLAAFTALVVVLIWARARAESLRQRLDALELDAAEQGLLEDT